MKAIRNESFISEKQLEFVEGKDQPRKLTFEWYAKNVVNFPDKGVDYLGIKKRFDLLDKIVKQKDNEKILLEDSEWEFLKQLGQQTSWVVIEMAIYRFQMLIENAETVEVAEAKADPKPQNKKNQ